MNVGRPWKLTESARNLLRLAIEFIEIVAEQVNRSCGGVARQRLLDALREERLDREVDAEETRQRVPDIRLGSFGYLAAQWLQVHLEFTVMRAPGIVGLFGTPDALGNGSDHRQFSQGIGDALSNPQRLIDRCARYRRHVDDEVPFPELGYEARVEQR